MRALGVLAMDAPDGLAHVVIGGGGHGAGVQHHQVGARTLARGRKSFGGEQRFQGGAIGLSSPAAEILNEEFPHLYSV